MKHFQIINLKSAAIEHLEEMETNMAGVLCFTFMKCSLQNNKYSRSPRGTLIELSIKSWKWFCSGLYKAPSQNEKYFLDNLSLAMTKMSCE